MNNTKVLLLLCGLIALSFAKTQWFQLDNYTFEHYIKEYRKSYANEAEYQLRKSIFEAKLQSIRAHNKDSTKTWKNGVNHLSDRTEDEFKQLLGYRKEITYSTRKEVKNTQTYPANFLSTLPASVDWRQKGVITAVKDQGQCGSCWTFGTAESIESHWAIATGYLTDLSEQNILDCTPNPQKCGGTGGCQGGTPELAYQQLISIGGIASEWTYPYISYFGQNYQCNNHSTPVVRLSGYQVLPSNQYAPVMNALANVGPLAVNVDASSWSSYESGVYNGCNQVNPDIDHVVQLVGYGTDPKNGDYWLIRNSWSPLWGEDGYIRIYRTSNVQCGIDLNPSDGTGCQGGPSQVTVCGTCAILYDVSYPTIAH